MDLVNISRSRRFLRERPIRVNLFDRPRMVCDLLCLETDQTEKRRGLATSDSLYVVMEGKARLTTGPQVEELEEQDAALVPPGVDHTIENLGPGRLTLMALVTPKPSRAGEVRMPAEGRPRRTYAEEDSDSARDTERRVSRDDNERPPRRQPPRRFDGPPPRRGFDDRPPPRDRRPPRPAVNREARGETEKEGPVWFPKPKPAWRPRGAPPAGGGRSGAGRPSGPPRGRGGPSGQRDRTQADRRGQGESRGRPGAERSEAPGNRRGPSPSSSRPAPRGGGRGRPAPRQNGRPAPGRSGPKTSERRQSRE